MRCIIYALMGFSVVNNTVACCLTLVFAMVQSLATLSPRYFAPFWFTHGALNLLLDMITWFIPLPTVFSVMRNLSTRKRILLGLEFSLGMLCWCSVILRISLRQHVVVLGGDPSYNAPILSVLTVAEVSLAISCASVVALRPLAVKITKGFNRLRGKPLSTNKSRSSGFGFGASQSLAQSRGYGFRPGSRITLNKGGFEEHTAAHHELMEWEDDALDINRRPQLAQQTCSCPCRGGDDAELRDIVQAHVSSCPMCPHDLIRGTQLQVPAPISTTTRRASSPSIREALRVTNIGGRAHSRT